MKSHKDKKDVKTILLESKIKNIVGKSGKFYKIPDGIFLHTCCKCNLTHAVQIKTKPLSIRFWNWKSEPSQDKKEMKSDCHKQAIKFILAILKKEYEDARGDKTMYGTFREGYLMGFSDAVETIKDRSILKSNPQRI